MLGAFTLTGTLVRPGSERGYNIFGETCNPLGRFFYSFSNSLKIKGVLIIPTLRTHRFRLSQRFVVSHGNRV
ncbi:hypothetical protein ABID20_001784 [Rhizobium alvei]